MKELKRKLSEIRDYNFEVCFYEENFIIVRVTDKDFKMDVKLMIELKLIADLIMEKYRIKVIFSTTDFYKDLNFEMI